MSPRVAARMAYVASGLNALAALALLVVLRPGLPAGGAGAEQLAYVVGHRGQWWAGWLVWHAAAIALLGFYVGLAGLWWRRASVRCVLALLCSASGLAADLSAEAIYMGLGPRMSPEGFALAQDIAGLLTGYVGNGLYTAAGILLTWAGSRELPRSLLVPAVPLWAAGLGLSAASLTHSATAQFWSTAVLMPTFIVWAALVGRWIETRAS